MTAPAVASVGAASSFSGTTISVGVPSGVASGSLVIAWVAGTWAETGTAPTSAAITPASGFTLATGSWTTNLDSAFSAYSAGGWYYKYASGSDSGTYAFTTSSVASTAAAGGGGYSQRITGGPTSGNPFTDSFHSGGRATMGLTFTVTTFTPTAGNTLLLGGAIWDDNPSPATYTNPTSWTSSAQAANATIGEIFGVGYLQQTIAAATGTLTYTYGGSTGSPGMAVVGSIRTPSGGTQYPVSGTVAGASAVAGAVKARRSVTGTAAGSSAMTGAVHALRPVSGGVAATSAVTGAAHARLGVSGTVAAISHATGSVGVRAAVAGAVHALSAVAGIAHSIVHVTGVVVAASHLAGSVSIFHPSNAAPYTSRVTRPGTSATAALSTDFSASVTRGGTKTEVQL